MIPQEGDTIVVWFSRGAASAVAAKRVLLKYHNFCIVRVVTNPILEEDADNYRFSSDVEKWLGVPIEKIINEKYPSCSAADVWNQRRAMSFPHGAPCTDLLKKESRYQFEIKNRIDWHVMGFTLDEVGRYENFIHGERANTLPILIEDGLTKQDCGIELLKAGIKLPAVYTESSDFGDGYPNANCIGCVKATSPTYWNHVRQTRPHVFKSRAEQSRRLGVRLVRYKGKRIFLDELPPDARGRDMKTMKIECSIFCEG